MNRGMSQSGLILSYYRARPGRAIQHAEIVDWATAMWEKQTGRKLRDPDRAIRKLHEIGQLVKIRDGVYMYDPHLVRSIKLDEFSETLKEAIKKRDGYRCVICGVSGDAGNKLHVDHIKPKDKGGKATLENGQTLCSMHNMRKKNLGQTETGKKMFIRLYDAAAQSGDDALCEFIEDVLSVYEVHSINSHIRWKKPDGDS